VLAFSIAEDVDARAKRGHDRWDLAGRSGVNHVTAGATTLMNRMYRRQRHIYDITRKYYLLGRDLLIDRLAAPPGACVLEIGCGTGRNLILAAEKYPHARFFGVDVSTEMLTTAVEAISRAGLAKRVRVAHADATAFEAAKIFGIGRFDRIFVSYSLSMIPAWRTVVDRAIDHLAPGGELHIVDFGSQKRLPRSFRYLLRRWLALFHVTPRDELEHELMPRSYRAGAMCVIERPYRDYAQYARLSISVH
jgi:S-adenosylmethionine-diacylgycerolhomoserine-N-methlytransferase